MSTLENILGGGEAVSEGKTENEQVTKVATEGEGQQEQQTEGQQQEGEGEAGKTRMVPHEALNAEKQKVKRYTEEVADFRKSNEALQRQVGELLQRVPVPKQEQAAPPDQFEDGPGFVRHHVAQQVSPQLDQITQTLMANAQIVAGLKYGDDKVQEAEQAFVKAMQERTLDPSDYQRVAGSPNRYAAAVQWHQRQQAQAEIGDDPAAFKAKLEAEIREKVLAEINGGNGQQAQQRPATVTPSNLAGARNVGSRSGPAWAGPKPLSDIFDTRPPGTG